MVVPQTLKSIFFVYFFYLCLSVQQFIYFNHISYKESLAIRQWTIVKDEEYKTDRCDLALHYIVAYSLNAEKILNNSYNIFETYKYTYTHKWNYHKYILT